MSRAKANKNWTHTCGRWEGGISTYECLGTSRRVPKAQRRTLRARENHSTELLQLINPVNVCHKLNSRSLDTCSGLVSVTLQLAEKSQVKGAALVEFSQRRSAEKKPEEPSKWTDPESARMKLCNDINPCANLSRLILWNDLDRLCGREHQV